MALAWYGSKLPSCKSSASYSCGCWALTIGAPPNHGAQIRPHRQIRLEGLKTQNQRRAMSIKPQVLQRCSIGQQLCRQAAAREGNALHRSCVPQMSKSLDHETSCSQARDEGPVSSFSTNGLAELWWRTSSKVEKNLLWSQNLALPLYPRKNSRINRSNP